MKKIVITISPEGVVSVDAVGFTGISCKEALESFSKLGEVLSQEDKPELYQTSENDQWLTNKQ